MANGLRFTFSTPETNAPLIIGEWLSDLAGKGGRYLFPSRIREQPNLSTRQYARIVHQWMDRTDRIVCWLDEKTEFSSLVQKQ